MKPRFFCLEGIDGSGKSTQINLLQEELGRRGIPSQRLRDPGGTEISEKIRNIILNRKNDKIGPITELLLYAASRAQMIQEVILPALEQGRVVLADRYAWSTVAYQGYGRGLDLSTIHSLNQMTCGSCWPQHTFVLDIPVEEFRQRAIKEGRQEDRLESESLDFFERVRAGYLKLVETHQELFTFVDASRSPIAVNKIIVAKVVELLEKGGLQNA